MAVMQEMALKQTVEASALVLLILYLCFFFEGGGEGLFGFVVLRVASPMPGQHAGHGRERLATESLGGGGGGWEMGS